MGSALLRVLCLCSLVALARPARPANVSIGALFTFDSVIGRSARAAFDLAVAVFARSSAAVFSFPLVTGETRMGRRRWGESERSGGA